MFRFNSKRKLQIIEIEYLPSFVIFLIVLNGYNHMDIANEKNKKV